MKIENISLAVLLSLGLATAAQAGVNGTSSNSANIAIGTAEAGDDAPEDHVGGTAAISVASASSPWNMFMGFTALQGLAGVSHNQTLTVDSKQYKLTDVPVTLMPPSHSALGNYNFAQVLGVTPEVFFGEWFAAGETATGNSHTVYYAGDNTGRTVPTTGSATYKVVGVNGYNAATDNLLSGNLTATYGSGTSGRLNGSLTGGTASTKSVTLTNVGINASTGAFGTAIAGSASGTKQDNSAIGSGTVTGHFFGANAAALAGIVNFGSGANAKYNTAFGGSK